MNRLEKSWYRAWAGLQPGTDGDEIFKQLIAAYSEPHRHYHTLQHLSECIHSLEPVLHSSTHPAELEMAIWFHDAIYDVKSHDNEKRSAAWAASALQQAHVAEQAINRIENLIRATCHTTSPVTIDEQIILDIDLSILGTDPKRYDEYEYQIRQEYAWVPDEVFRKKRSMLLQAFIKRARIYCTDYFYDTLEQAVRDNLQRAIKRLNQ